MKKGGIVVTYTIKVVIDNPKDMVGSEDFVDTLSESLQSVANEFMSNDVGWKDEEKGHQGKVTTEWKVENK